MKYWRLSQPKEETVEALVEQTGLSRLVCEILAARRVDTPEAAQALTRRGEGLFDPYLLKDMDRAVRRISQAIEAGEKIVVYGDYDCDGVTATALLYHYLETVGADVLHYIPDREVEGYGLNKQAIDFLHQVRGTELIVTVDNGISAAEEIAYAAQLGIDVVVTDHHQPRETLPDAAAVVNPHRSDCESPFKNLSGVGVAFKLVCAMEGDLTGLEMLEHYGDLVCIGTVGDVVELAADNRVLVQGGLEQLCDPQRPGVQKLMEQSGISGGALTAETVAFTLVPRINAAGRMGDVYEALELLLTESEERAGGLAAQLEQYNRQRKETEAEILKQVGAQLSQNSAPLDERILLLSGEGWHHGVVGILCSRLVERFGKPCFLISLDGEEARASGRGVEGMSVVEGLAACSDLLTRFGGHPGAAGFSLERKNLEPFLTRFLDYYREKNPTMPYVGLKIDAALEPGEITLAAVDSLSVLEPFGCGNESPVFALLGYRLTAIQPLSGGKHLRLTLSKGGSNLTVLYFSMTPDRFGSRVGDTVDAVVTLGTSVYNGQRQLSIKVRDLRPSGFDQEGLFAGKQLYEQYRRGEDLPQIAGKIAPTREEVGLVYRFLRQAGSYGYGCEALYGALSSRGLAFAKMMVALDVLEELGFVIQSGLGYERSLQLVNTAAKADLANSKILQSIGKGR